MDTAWMNKLSDLTNRVRREIDMLSFPTKPWVIPRTREGKEILDVVIIGAGQAGLVVGHALRLRQIHNILVLDQNEAGFEGVWDTYARNYEMRSPKDVMGADMGVPSLCVQSYFEARYGEGSWETIKRVPRTDWMDYLRWYRHVVGLPIKNRACVEFIEYDHESVTVTLREGDPIRARFLVLATGMEGAGAWTIPDTIRRALPPDRYNHSADIFDPASLRGRRLGILGGGPSAFDTAVTALAAGAASVDLCLRRPSLPILDVVRELETVGIMDHSQDLADATKWGLARYLGEVSQCPAEHHFNLAFEYENFRMHLGSPWTSLEMSEGEIVVKTPKKLFRFDHIFSATGIVVDMGLRPELEAILAKAALWRDRFSPPPEERTSPNLNYPYLDRFYRFTEREPGAAPGLERIYAFNALAWMSMGLMSAAGITSFRFGVPRLVGSISAAIFAEQENQLIPAIEASRKSEMTLDPRIQRLLETTA